MKSCLALLLLLLSAHPSSPEQPKTFRDLQWKFPRVRTASAEKDALLREKFQAKGLPYPPHAIFLRAFKREASLELRATAASDQPYVLVHEYRICTSSGVLGPKRRFGDQQVPEGFYELDWFNPQSNFFRACTSTIQTPRTAFLAIGKTWAATFFFTETVPLSVASPSPTMASRKSIGLQF